MSLSGISGDVNGVRQTFSSWDSCMSKSYCKYPVIVGIVIGSLIVLSVLYCAIKILCCGAKCCFCCVSISKCLCCGCCRSSSSSPKVGSSGIKNNGYVQPQQYTNPAMSNAPYTSHAPPQYYNPSAPATATFDTPTTKRQQQHQQQYANGDALPAMPSWSDAQSRRVEDHTAGTDDLEMGKLEDHDPNALPKFTSDDYEPGTDGHTGAGAGAGAAIGSTALAGGATAAAGHNRPYNGAYSRQTSYGSTPGTGPQAGSTYGGYNQSAHLYANANSGYANQGYTTPARQDPNLDTSAAYGNGAYQPPQRQAPARQQQQGQLSPARTGFGIAPQQQQQQQQYAQQPSYASSYARPTQQQTAGSYNGSNVGGYGNSAPAAYPGQSSYRPRQTQQRQQQQQDLHMPSPPGSPSAAMASPQRRPVQGSWREV